MRIGELAKAAGVNVETVRFYERKGLIAQPHKPSSGGFRSYGHEIAARIRFIRQGQELGFSLLEIDELLSMRASPDSSCSDVRERAEQKRKDVDDKIVRLNHIRRSLTALIEACPGKGDLEFCSIIGALNGSDETPFSDRSDKAGKANGKDMNNDG